MCLEESFTFCSKGVSFYLKGPGRVLSGDLYEGGVIKSQNYLPESRPLAVQASNAR